MERKRLRIIIATIAIALVIVLSSFLYLNLPGPLNGIKVAIYTDRGIRATSRIALVNMFSWMDADVTIINSTNIANGDLDLYDILVMPGGCWCDERCQLLDEKMELVRAYVENGGVYFGIDGGASYATSYRLNLFHGALRADAFGTGDYLIEVMVNTNSSAPDLSTASSSYQLLYENSGYFDAEDMSGVIPICTYANTELVCMLAFFYGNGHVFLSSPHPEYEEGTMRDGTDLWDDTMNDPDSEWDFMLSIVQWLLA
ncbi:MAG: BPL-N domain-containing protein [Candidatus Thorarchaeota archaeon]